jgi:hypothetical protein
MKIKSNNSDISMSTVTSTDSSASKTKHKLNRTIAGNEDLDRHLNASRINNNNNNTNSKLNHKISLKVCALIYFFYKHLKVSYMK